MAHLKVPANNRSEPDIPLDYVECIEQSDAADRLEGHQLTNEAVHANEIIGYYYKRRWLIED